VSKVGFFDTIRIGISGLRTRKLRSALSAFGITVGIAALVAVIGLSESGRADLMRELDELGTNLLTVEAGEGFGQSEARLPEYADDMIRRIRPVYEVATISRVSGGVFRNDRIDDGRTKGITIFASDLNLMRAQRGSMAAGSYLTDLTAEFPSVVLGSVAAERLGVFNSIPNQKVWLKNKWFNVIGVLNPLPLAADLDRGALISYEAAEKYLDHNNVIDVIYIRADPEYILDVRSVMAATVNPERPEEVQVSRASDVLEAKAAAQNTFTNLFVGLGTVALFVGGLGIANVMVIAVIERRNEIGLRRALGATRFDIAAQFLTESLSLSGIGGVAGTLLGILVTIVYSSLQQWPFVIPLYALVGSIVCSLLIGASSGFYPALRASKMSPTEALRTR